MRTFSSRLLGCLLLALSLGKAVAQIEIVSPPQDQRDVPLGARAEFQVIVKGDGPFFFQWRLNGVNIPDATKDTLRIPVVALTNGGAYTVAISDGRSSTSSPPALLTFELPKATGRDSFQEALNLPPQGALRSANFGATFEKGEPRHEGKPGGSSIWFRWTAPATGLARFATAGSSFDTLLGVYIGQTLPELTRVPSAIADDDRGGFHTSEVLFNADEGRTYLIAVDGLAGAEGEVVLNWQFDDRAPLLPVISFTSPDQTVPLGGTVTLAFGTEDPFTAEWFFNDERTGVDGNIFTIDSITPSQVGRYHAVVRDVKTGGSISTRPIRVQINVQGDGTFNPNSRAYDRLVDAAEAVRNPGQGQRPGHAATGLASGYTSSQIFSTLYSTKDPGEPNHCDVLGGASEWYAYQPTNAGTLQINTAGSSYDTVIAVYSGPGTSFASLIDEACNNLVGFGTDKVLFSGTSGTTYFIAVDGVLGAKGTAYINVNFGDPPFVVAAPTNRVVAAGSNVMFSVSATGSGPLRYQWQFNGTNILQATNSSYTVTNAQISRTGIYAVAISNVITAITSAPASLSLFSAPTITAQPTNRVVVAGSNVTFSVSASGNPPPIYQWHFGAVPLVGSTNSFYTVSNAQPSHAGTYSVSVSNTAGLVISSNATLTVNVPPSISFQPVSQTNNAGSLVTFNVTAAGTAPLRYQWLFGESPIAGQTNTSLVLNNVQNSNAGAYRVVITNVAGSLTSSTAHLVINPPVAPVFLIHPISQTISQGSFFTLTSSVTGVPMPSFQWQKAGTNLFGATATNLVFANFQMTNEGLYRIVASNSAGVAMSSNAFLALNSPLRIGTFTFTNPLAEIHAIGRAGYPHVLESSSNLIHWISVQTNPTTSGFASFVHTNAPAGAFQFYRVRED